jgi:signal transduction histidine kinase
MTRQEALELLFGESAHDRFRAARALESLATIEDQTILRRARHLEKDAYVIKRIDAAIQKCFIEDTEIFNEPIFTEDVQEIVKTQRSAAIEWIAGLLLHEIGAKIGLIDLSAQSEINEYAKSKTKKNIVHLQEIFEGIAQLKSAAATPQFVEFSLANLLDQIIDVEVDGKDISISRVGERPSLVVGDPRLIRLAICNGIRNGIEAVLTTKLATIKIGEKNVFISTAEIVISWGSTDTDHWITVIDQGPGINDSARFFSVGTSTKNGHAGFGLAIAKQAIESANGTIGLYSSPSGGATYEIRWRKN